MTRSTSSLRKVLLLDALTSGAMGLLLSLGARLLAGPLGLDAGLLTGAGLALLPFSACVLFVARRAAASRAQVAAIVAMNALWVFDSVLILLAGWVQPTALGVLFIAVQALTVALFTLLQVKGLQTHSLAEQTRAG